MRDDNTHFVQLPAFTRKKIDSDYFAALGAIRSWQLTNRQVDRLLAYVIARDIGLTQKQQIDAVHASLDDLLTIPMRSTIIDDPVKWQQANTIIRRCAYRLAANKDRLKNSLSAEYAPLSVPEYWAIARIVGIEPIRGKGKDNRLKIAYRILTGRLAGRQYIDTVKQTVSKGVYGTLTGWPRRCGFSTPKLLIGLHAVLSISMHERRLAMPRMGITKSLRASNVTLCRNRVRNLSSCPHGSPLDCVQCPVGVNECSNSVQVTHTQRIKRHDNVSRART